MSEIVVKPLGTVSPYTDYKDNTLEKFAKDADLLICESSLIRGQMGDSKHLYVYEAAMIAKSTNVKKLMLIHFWPEIDREKYVLEAQEIFKNVVAAEEGKKLVFKRGNNECF